MPETTIAPKIEVGGVLVQHTVERLREWAHLERACIRALAGWFLLVPPYEVKIGMGHALWGHAERVDALRRRLADMRGGHHEANLGPELLRTGEALLAADDPADFFRRYRVVLAHLQSQYAEYERAADRSANAVELRLVRQLQHDLATTLRWVDELPSVLRPAPVSSHEPETLRSLTPARVFKCPDTIVFDDRIRAGSFDSYNARMDLPFEEKRIAECRIYFNEFYAAGLLATILLDAWDTPAPWAFFHDLSHHFYDEVRHAEFGMLRLTELGVLPDTVNLTLMEHAVTMPFLHRLCYLTLGLEVYFMPRKRPRVKRYQDAGDARTQLFADVDWSDEGNHVQYGKRWVSHFLQDDARSVEELRDEIAQHMSTTQQGFPAGELAPY